MRKVALLLLGVFLVVVGVKEGMIDRDFALRHKRTQIFAYKGRDAQVAGGVSVVVGAALAALGVFWLLEKKEQNEYEL